jgi:hypothetical protein
MHASRESYSKTRYADVEVIDSPSVHYNSLRIGSVRPQGIANQERREGLWRIGARKAFDAALGQELHQVIQEAKRMAREIKQSSDLWDLELHLTQRRKEIDRKYDFRGSRLTHVLGRLLCEGRVNEEQLSGLREDKLKSIRSHAKFLAEEADAA